MEEYTSSSRIDSPLSTSEPEYQSLTYLNATHLPDTGKETFLPLHLRTQCTIEPPLRRIRHLLIVYEGSAQQAYELKDASYFVGRDSSNTIVLASKDISRHHAIFLRITDKNPHNFYYLLVDGNLQGRGSVNGTKINGESSLSSRLYHGDQIQFGCQIYASYLILCPLTDEEFDSYCAEKEYEELLSRPLDSPSTILFHKPNDKRQDIVSLVRLASFPEILPCPMFEVELNGTLTYLNPAAMEVFPELPIQGLEHPTLMGLAALVQESGHRVWRREVVVGNQIFEQAIQYIAENGLIRSCLFEITQRKYAESELLKRDRLLQSVAQANAQLLANVGVDEAINHAIATFGMATETVRVRIYEFQAMGMVLRFEWQCEALNQPQQLQAPDTGPNLPFSRWSERLLNGQLIRESVRSQPEDEQAPWAEAGISSIMAIPIMVDNGFWGAMELAYGSIEPDWSAQEESIVWTLVNSISGTLQRQRKDAIIKRQAYYDALTGLPNRILFGDRLELALANARRHQHSLAVMFLDLDRFKSINDTLGHSAGDALLEEVAQRVKTCLREGDTFARWGGDEFTVLLPQIERVECATITAQRVLNVFQAAIELEGQEIYTNTSIGIALYPADGKEAETLLKNADVALYEAKERGRGVYQLYNQAIDTEVSEQFELRNHLQHACDRNQLLLHYQPQFDLKSGRITGVEALVRWQHPQKGMISPANFIPLAEETGLIIEIGAWVLRTACEQGVRWHQAGLSSLKVSVNLSARQFFDPNLVDAIAEILEQTQFDPHFLELEITETTAIKNLGYTQEVVQHLQAMGIQIGMDDFGTGYSSLNYLTQLSFDVLKVDQCFIQNLQLETKEFQIIQAIISLAIGLGLTVVAEGVDAQTQLDLLRMLDCPLVQGYFMCPPMATEQVTEILQTKLHHKIR